MGPESDRRGAEKCSARNPWIDKDGDVMTLATHRADVSHLNSTRGPALDAREFENQNGARVA